MNLQQRAEFERQLEAYLIACGCSRIGARDHNARCDLITWVERNVELIPAKVEEHGKHS